MRSASAVARVHFVSAARELANKKERALHREHRSGSSALGLSSGRPIELLTPTWHGYRAASDTLQPLWPPPPPPPSQTPAHTGNYCYQLDDYL